ncbi:hypothetical protein [Haloarcula onubensis]|uniref:Uncharacterized protein n=1 Tax=Haloarcula onubensis TaxID=2950539 RepID=A0ABU2FVH6_9EURY|nr:hypothetical protein [Halomicroarcula sp. S3CR25-11]MDS0284748.1 hypothetical protein [Halomicroarcula sp. S3CR25-11]
MSLPDPTDVIAPRDDDVPYDAVDFLKEMFQESYLDGAVLEYHGLQLYSQHYEDGDPIWDVYTEDDAYIDTLNLAAFRTVTELQRFLDEIVAYDPADRDEWVSSR